jgi:hypothetical protein
MRKAIFLLWYFLVIGTGASSVTQMGLSLLRMRATAIVTASRWILLPALAQRLNSRSQAR